MPDPKVVERVQKLIALAGSNNENEARNAAYLAAKLIREHKLSIGGGERVVFRDHVVYQERVVYRDPPPPAPPPRVNEDAFDWETFLREREDSISPRPRKGVEEDLNDIFRGSGVTK